MPRDTIARPRLHRALTGGSPLVVIRGATGSGKTTLAAQWAQARPPDSARGVWFTVDSEATGRLSFWYELLNTLVDAQVLPCESPLAISAPALDSSPDLRRLLVRGFTQLSRPLVLVIDDFHVVTDEQVAADLLALLAACPDLRIITLTRSWTPLERGTSWVRLEGELILPTDLLFTASEVREVLEVCRASAQVRALADQLHRNSGGLPLTVRTVLFMVERDAFDVTEATLQQRIHSAASMLITDMFGLQSRDDELVEFALRCSVAEHLTTELAEQLGGRPDAARLLDEAERVGAGWWSLSSGAPHFAFSPGVRQALESELAQRHPDQMAALHSAVARWSFDQGDAFAALRHAVAAGDFELAGRVIVRDYTALLARYSHELRALIGSLPLGTLRMYPLLTMVLALAFNMVEHHRARGLEYFVLATIATKSRGSKATAAEQIVLLTIEHTALRVLGQFGRSLQVAERASARFASLSVEDRDELTSFLPTFHNQLGVSYFYAGRGSRAIESCNATYSLSLAGNRRAVVGRLHALALLGGKQALHGNFPESLKFTDHIDAEVWPEGLLDGYVGAFAQVAYACAAVEAGDWAGAQRCISVMDPHIETIEHWPVFMYLQTMVWLATGEGRAGLVSLTFALKKGVRAKVTAQSRSMLDSCRALLALSVGDARTAEKMLGNRDRTTEALIARTRLHLFRGRAELAMAELASLDVTDLSARFRSEVLTLRAAAALRLKRAEEGASLAATAAAVMTDRGMWWPFLLLCPTDRQAVLLAAEEGQRGPHTEMRARARCPITIPDGHESTDLTERELAVIRQLERTASTAEIAETLYVSVNTVKTQLRSIYRKLGVGSREEALRRAAAEGLLDV